MLFSVIIPAYNCKNSLENTVDSVLQSGIFDFEIVIVDDGSTDGTAEVCSTLQKKFDKIRCMRQKNTGVSSARNCGIETAKGEYVLFFDSDDTVDAGALKHAAEIIQKALPDMLIFGLSFDYYFHGKMYRRDDLVYPNGGLMSREQWSSEFIKLYECNALSPVWNKFIRRDVLNKYQIRFRRDLIEMEDFLFVIHCMGHCDNIYVLPEVIYRYHQAENERSTFNRLCRIPSLSAYMQPFEESIQELMSQILFESEAIPSIYNVVNQIYVSLFYEQIHFGDIAEIERAAKDMLEGKYADTIKSAKPKLFQLLEERKYRQVWFQSIKVRLRHQFAVRVKYVRNCRRA